jgi:hypothetical protein
MLQQQLQIPNALQLIQQTTLTLTAEVRFPHAVILTAASCQLAARSRDTGYSSSLQPQQLQAVLSQTQQFEFTVYCR